jgi:hypothetical protein
MLKGNRVLFVIFVTLLLVCLGEVAYYFYTKSNTQKTTQETITNSTQVTETPKSTQTTTVSKAPSESINLLTMMITSMAASPLDGWLRDSVKLVNGTLIADNSDRNETIGFGVSEPITLNSPFRLKMKFHGEGKGNLTEVILNGKTSSSSTNWWEGTHEISFMDFRDIDNLIIEVRDGTSPKAPLIVSLPEISGGEALYVDFLDPAGKQFAVFDENGTILKTVDVTKQTGVNLPNGIFPEKRMTIRCQVFPKMKTKIEEFVLSFVSE